MKLSSDSVNVYERKKVKLQNNKQKKKKDLCFNSVHFSSVLYLV